MDDVLEVLKHWKLDLGAVRQQVYRAPTPRERERWHAVWLLAGGWTATQVAEALERDPHTIGEWLANFRQAGPAGLSVEHTGGSPRPEPRPAGRAEGGGPGPPRAVGIELADWNWKVVRAFVQRRFGLTLGGSSCRNYLHRLGFVLKRPKKRLVKASADKRGRVRARVRAAPSERAG